ASTSSITSTGDSWRRWYRSSNSRAVSSPMQVLPVISLGSLVGGLEHGAQQHVAAVGQVLRRSVLDLVVADATFAGHEDHPCRAQLGEEDRVVAGATDDVHVAQAQLAGTLAHG